MQTSDARKNTEELSPQALFGTEKANVDSGIKQFRRVTELEMSSQSGYVVEDNYIDRMLESRATQQELVCADKEADPQIEDESQTVLCELLKSQASMVSRTKHSASEMSLGQSQYDQFYNDLI